MISYMDYHTLEVDEIEMMETQMMNESHTISSMGGSADSQEGISTFLAKRSPRFNGR
jgi:enoyl-CoA hydratase/carnithine racemase